ncbi:hypothetical protein LSH36_1127g00061 [Paralvinella palmiformis]|uniref:oleoyl-[acyl-carrier-protein] hydrolase n=1 Tax=Paralvinella palmiformis TaxID=53620 RepID=A0AAD9IV63_9ANNE|nr:hypothetical protein LSH36_1127g00061 [Paralvinella palmiformis]
MPVDGISSAWFNNLHPRPEAECRLFCFPWCGGGSQFFARWGEDFANIEVLGIRFPGRENRIKESMVSDISKIITPVCDEIAKNYFDKPFAFFGHSMGTIFCYEAAAYLKEKYGKEPKHIFFSAEYAPHSKVRKDRLEDKTLKALHEYSDVELIERIGKHGGTPKMFLENKDFMVNTFLPPYRNDLKMIGMYYRPMKGKKQLSCPVTAFDGDRDVNHHLYEFSEITSGRFQQMKFPGHHFYLLKEDNTKRLRDVITRALT